MTAHRILIGTAIVFFAFYGWWELAGARAGRGPGGTLRGGLGLLACAALLVYFRTLAGRKTGAGGGSEGGDR